MYQMFKLETEKSRFFRIRRGLEKADVEIMLECPVPGETFCGRIIECGGDYRVYVARPGDNYRSLAVRFGVTEEELKNLNSGKIIYPTCRIFAPLKQQ